MNRILLGNLISFLASLMLTAGCLMKDPKKVYAMQVAENLTLVVSSVCFGSWSGITTLLISTVRNVLLVKGHFDKKRMYLFSHSHSVQLLRACDSRDQVEPVCQYRAVGGIFFRDPGCGLGNHTGCYRSGDSGLHLPDAFSKESGRRHARKVIAEYKR